MPCMPVTGIVRARAGDRARPTKTCRSSKNDGEEVVDMQYPVPLVSLSQHLLISLKQNGVSKSGKAATFAAANEQTHTIHASDL